MPERWNLTASLIKLFRHYSKLFEGKTHPRGEDLKFAIFAMPILLPFV